MAPWPLESGEEAAKEEHTPMIVEDEVYGIDLTPQKDGGVRKIVLREGEGAEMADVGCTVCVSYVGKFLNGDEFDSNTGGMPFEFVLGEGVVINGWDIGLATMKKGEKAVLTCKPEYAYGEKGGSKIPPNSTLQFTIELLDWKGIKVTNNWEVSKVVLTKGEGYDRPNTGASIEAHITGSYNGQMFEDRDVSFTFGEASEAGLIDGVEEAIGHMIRGEKSKVFIKPGRYSFGPEGRPDLGIPPDAEIIYHIEVKEFEKFKEAWELGNDEKIATALRVKEKGTKFFKEGKYKIACRQYAVVVKMLEGYFDDEEKKTTNPIKCAGHLNVALCQLKLENYHKCIKSCDKALDIEKQNIKAIFRRGKARFNLKDYDHAKEDFKQVLSLDPNNRETREQLKIVNQKLKEHHAVEKKIYSNMFEKLAELDARSEQSKKTKTEDTDVFQAAVDEAEKNVEQMSASSTPGEVPGEEDVTMKEQDDAVKC